MAKSEMDDCLKLDLTLFHKQKDDVPEALLDWVNKIKSLGEVVSELAHQSKENGSQTLEWCGVELGDIISDYSRFTEYTLREKVLPELIRRRAGIKLCRDEPLVKVQ